MTREFIQVRPSNGFLIHAVPADVARSTLGEYWANGRVLCGKIKTLDAQRLPNLLIQFDRDSPVYGSQPLPFTSAMHLNETVCKKCAERVMQASG